MSLATLITVVVVLLILGVLVYFAETQLPLSPPFRTALRIVVVLGLLIWLLNFFGLWQWGSVHSR